MYSPQLRTFFHWLQSVETVISSCNDRFLPSNSRAFDFQLTCWRPALWNIKFLTFTSVQPVYPKHFDFTRFKQVFILYHRRSQGGWGLCRPKVFSTSCHFELWESVSQAKYCWSPKVKNFGPPKKLSWLRQSCIDGFLKCLLEICIAFLSRLTRRFFVLHTEGVGRIHYKLSCNFGFIVWNENTSPDDNLYFHKKNYRREGSAVEVDNLIYELNPGERVSLWQMHRIIIIKFITVFFFGRCFTNLTHRALKH